MNNKFRQRWKIASGGMPSADFVIEFDGGTSCNIPRKGFGVGYGSKMFRENDNPNVMIKALKATKYNLERKLDEAISLSCGSEKP